MWGEKHVTYIDCFLCCRIPLSSPQKPRGTGHVLCQNTLPRDEISSKHGKPFTRKAQPVKINNVLPLLFPVLASWFTMVYNTPHCWSSNYCSSVTGQMGWVVHLNECLYCSIRVYSLFRYLNVSLFCGRVNITVCNPSLSSNSHYHQTLQASETFRPS